MLDFKSTGDLQILANLYQRYMDLVYGICLKYLNNNDDAKDATINIYVELIDKLKKYPVDNFKGWLYQLSKNHCLMILRKKKTKPVHIDSENMEFLDDRHPEASQLKEFQFIEMQKCIEQNSQFITQFFGDIRPHSPSPRIGHARLSDLIRNRLCSLTCPHLPYHS